MKQKLCLALLLFSVLTRLAAESATVIRPILLIDSSDEPIRDITASADGNLFTFDYADYRIRKYSPDGRLLHEFGGKGQSDGLFVHLTGISCRGDRLLAIDSTGVSAFDTNGTFLKRTVFAAELTPDHTMALGDGRFLGYQIVAAELKAVLTLRNLQGIELARLASHDLRDFFPELKAGEDFFISDQYCRKYLYSVDNDEKIVWAASDAVRLYRFDPERLSSEPFFERDMSPLPISAGELESLNRKKQAARPPFHMYVPRFQPLLLHLVTMENAETWAYVHSRQFQGFMRISPQGLVLGTVELQADFDIRSALVRRSGRRLFFISGRKLYVHELKS